MKTEKIEMNPYYDASKINEHGFLKHPKTIKTFKKFFAEGRFSNKKRPNLIPMMASRRGEEVLFRTTDTFRIDNLEDLALFINRLRRSGNFSFMASDGRVAAFFYRLMLERSKVDERANRNKIKNKGQYDMEKDEWITEPVISVPTEDGGQVGIASFLNKTMRVFYERPEKKRITFANVFNAESMGGGLKTNDIVEFEKKVDGLIDGFYKIFNAYPKSFYSSGSILKAGIEKKRVGGMFSMFHLMNSKDFSRSFEMATESFSAGMIESFKYGVVSKAFYTDINGAYLDEIKKIGRIKSVRKVEKVEKEKNHKGFFLINAELFIPDINYSPVNVRSPQDKKTNIRPSGSFIHTITDETAGFIERAGGTVKPLEVLFVEMEEPTQGFKKMIDTIEKEKEKGNIISKVVGNSVYGSTFEGYKTSDGSFETGELFNPFIATLITSRVRLKMAEMMKKIEDGGGTLLQVLTDSIIFQLDTDQDLAAFGFGEETGMFSRPEKVTNVYLLGSGRYFYKNEKGQGVKKNRGFNDFLNLEKIIEKAKEQNKTAIEIDVPLEGTVGQFETKAITKRDLGGIFYQSVYFDLMSGSNKRWIENDQNAGERMFEIDNPIGTKTKLIVRDGDGNIEDFSYPEMRAQKTTKKGL